MIAWIRRVVQAAVLRGRPPQRTPFSLRMRPLLCVRRPGRRGGGRWRCASAGGRAASGLLGVVGVVGIGDGGLPQRSGVRSDRVRPGGVGRREAQFDLVLLRPAAADVAVLVADQAAEDDVNGCAVGSGGAGRLQRGQRVCGALPAVVDAPQAVVPDRAAASETARTPRVRCKMAGTRSGRSAGDPAGAGGRSDTEWAELVEGEDPVGEVVQHVRRRLQDAVAADRHDSSSTNR